MGEGLKKKKEKKRNIPGETIWLDGTLSQALNPCELVQVTNSTSKALAGMGFIWVRPLASPLSSRKKRWSTKTGGETDLGLIKWSLSQKAALMWSVTLHCPGKKKEKKNFFKEMIKWKHLQKEPGGAGAKWMDWWEGTRSPLSRNTKGGEMGLSGGESGLRPNNHQQKSRNERQREVCETEVVAQDVQRNNPKTISLHPSLSILAKHFQGFDGGPLLGANTSEISLKGETSQSYWAEGAQLCLCWAEKTMRAKKTKGTGTGHRMWWKAV